MQGAARVIIEEEGDVLVYRTETAPPLVGRGGTPREALTQLKDKIRAAIKEGAFDGDRSQKIDKPTRWSSVYDAPSGMGAVTYVLEAPADDDWRTRYWDVPGRYRKHYLATFLSRTVPAGREFHYRVVTVPFEAAESRWKEEAARVAGTCQDVDTGSGR